MITSAGLAHETANYDWHGLKRGRSPWALLQVTLAGEGHLDYEGQGYALHRGQAMLLHLPHDHRYYLPVGQTWRFFYVCLHGLAVMDLWRKVIDTVGPVINLPETSDLFQRAAETCLRVLDGAVRSPWQAARDAYALATTLGETILPADDTQPNAARPPAIAAAIHYATAHLHEPIGASQLAQAAGLSRAYFSRLFAETEGLPPGEFLTRQRMQRAARLLRNSDATVADVAGQCGYRDTSYFCRAFRNTYGASPGQFRSSGMY